MLIRTTERERRIAGPPHQPGPGRTEGRQIPAMSRSLSSDQKIRVIGAEPDQCNLDTVAAADLRAADLVGAEIVIHFVAFAER